MGAFVVCFTLFGCWFRVLARLFCWNDFVVQIGSKLLCVNDGIAGGLALHKTPTVGH